MHMLKFTYSIPIIWVLGGFNCICYNDCLSFLCNDFPAIKFLIFSVQVFSPEELLPVDISNSDPKPALLNPDDEEALLMGHIQEIQKEKALLTSALPSLTRTTSDDDLLSTDIDDGSLDDVTSHLEEGEQERKSAHAV